MKCYFLLILVLTAVACAANRDDLLVQLPAQPQDLWQDEVHTSVSLSIVNVTRRERL